MCIFIFKNLQMNRWLFKATDNSPLILFRIIFGLLITFECWGAIATGWVRRNLIAPEFTFNFIHFDFLQPLSGNGMYIYYIVMGITGIGIMLGYRYFFNMLAFTFLWAGCYLMQKTSYNNHYYLLMILNIIMCLLPANKDLSLDVKFGYTKKSEFMPYWCKFTIIAQLAIVYFYASIAKLYPDWLSGKVPGLLMASKSHYHIIGDLLQENWVHMVITYVGILFDLLIIPALLWKPTRKFAFAFSIFFHLYNSIVLQIGIFPYLALSFILFFFPPEKIRKWFYPKNKKIILTTKPFYSNNYLIVILVSVWLVVQFALPLRHWFIPGDVLWTEEGHRLSWRMMLRQKSGTSIFYIKEIGKEEKKRVNLSDYLTRKQIRSMGGKPDMIWQFAQHLRKVYKEEGIPVEVYVDNKTKVNQSEYRQLINPNTDLAAAKWNYWGHNDWINIE